MDNCKVLKLDLHSKIIYFVFHLCGPIALCGILGFLSIGVFNTFIPCLAIVALGIIAGLYFSIVGIIKYRKYVILSDNTLMVCKGKITSPFVIQKFNLSETDQFSISSNGINLNQNDKDTTILYLKASPICTFILAGMLMPPIHRRGKIICENLLKEINNYRNQENIVISDEKNNLGIGFYCWVVNSIFIFISIIVMLVISIWGVISTLQAILSFHSSKYSKIYDEKIKNDPNNPVLYFGRSIYKNGKDAISDLDKAIELNPKYVEAYTQRGMLKDSLGNYEGTIKDCNKALELDSKHYDAYVCLGIVKTSQKEYKTAEDYLNKAIEIAPDNENAYYYKWELYINYKPKEADAMYKKYKEVQEKNEIDEE